MNGTRQLCAITISPDVEVSALIVTNYLIKNSNTRKHEGAAHCNHIYAMQQVAFS